jgi:hypothetical protein
MQWIPAQQLAAHWQPGMWEQRRNGVLSGRWHIDMPQPAPDSQWRLMRLLGTVDGCAPVAVEPSGFGFAYINDSGERVVLTVAEWLERCDLGWLDYRLAQHHWKPGLWRHRPVDSDGDGIAQWMGTQFRLASPNFEYRLVEAIEPRPGHVITDIRHVGPGPRDVRVEFLAPNQMSLGSYEAGRDRKPRRNVQAQSDAWDDLELPMGHPGIAEDFTLAE